MTKKVKAGDIVIELDPEMLNDPRFVRCFGKLANDRTSDEQRTYYFNRLCDLLFGDLTDDIMDALAEEHGGQITNEAFIEWLGGVLDDGSVKN